MDFSLYFCVLVLDFTLYKIWAEIGEYGVVCASICQYAVLRVGHTKKAADDIRDFS